MELEDPAVGRSILETRFYGRLFAPPWGETTKEGIAMSSLMPLQDLPAIEKKGGGICVTVLCNNTLLLSKQVSYPAMC